MKLREYLSVKRGRLSRLARQIGAHPPDLSRWASGQRPIPVEYGAAIEQATGGLVSRKEQWPDDWRRIWPELADRKEGANA